MTFTKRERALLIATAVVLGGLLLFTQVVSPLWEARNQAKADRANWASAIDRADLTFHKGRKMKAKWREIITAGMKPDREEADSQVNRAVEQWARQASLKITSFVPKDRTTGNPLVPERAFRLSGEGAIRAVRDFLLRMETAKFPLRIQRLDVSCPKSGTTNLALNVTVEFSTLYVPDGMSSPASPDVGATLAGGEVK